MKHFFTLMMIITMAETVAFAQSSMEPRRWEFGAILGTQLSFSVPREGWAKPVKGIVTGLDVGYRFQDAAKGWSVHLQPYFAGSRSKGTSGAENTNFYLKLTSKLRSVNAPLLARYTFSDGKIRPFAELGAQFMVSSRGSYKISGLMCPEGVPCDPVSDEQSNQKTGAPRVTALASAGVVIDAGKVTIPITVRLIENVKKLETYNIAGVDYKFPKARVLQLTAGVTF
ncbi:outer membrane beta-barrel protein [Dyadobacter jiangsuensis]|uniref:Outer membrane protein with beta-barrel domain n=1 Tax=Dyadobacter jiangsuensis TaxID=1591085 RepID=A0A2P8GBB7_9BACT|nr:outer membrane beta-barrel protein [Dyadobacter jiangsuensis]PSL31253.1 outer membrane protein with beta-barrel domain [Dyadobacter jiangsuensis]